ncbi:MAG: TaqI-like C-terminal specificity domain-containing protein, partial [Caldisericia bacterium]|nr:TaqI-like C-terminal specificity domain-containing protein [Caldisericia bacterium]
VENIQCAIEPDLLYPLLRGRDVRRWKAEPSAYIIMAQDPVKRKGIDEDIMKTKYPKTYMYLKRFEEVLMQRKSRGIKDMIKNGAPFYTMFAVGDYTFAPYKVIWPNIASEITSSVISYKDNKLILPQHIITLVACDTLEEAHYLCAIMNSNIVNFALQAYSMRGGKSFGDPHVLQNIYIPKFSSKSYLHLYLANLSEKAHELSKNEDVEKIEKIEKEINEVSAQIWGLTEEELKEINISLNELKQ